MNLVSSAALRMVSATGRPRGRPRGGFVFDMAPGLFRAKYRALLEEHLAKGWPRPKEIDLCESFDPPVSRSTLWRYLAAHSIPWPPE